MGEQVDLKLQLLNLMQDMSNPVKRNQVLTQVPEHLQKVFQSPDARFDLIGQDGTQALIDLQNHILHGQPISQQSITTIEELRKKLLATTTAVTTK